METEYILRLSTDEAGTIKLPKSELFKELEAGNIVFKSKDDICFFELKTKNNQIVAVIERQTVHELKQDYHQLVRQTKNISTDYHREYRRANSLERQIKGIATNIIKQFPEMKKDLI